MSEKPNLGSWALALVSVMRAPVTGSTTLKTATEGSETEPGHKSHPKQDRGLHLLGAYYVPDIAQTL